jgi:hypothetical protein
MKGQASLEYLLTYALAFFILISAVGLLIDNRPNVSPPDICDTNGPFRCVEFAQNSGSLLVLFEPTGGRDITVGNISMTFRNATSDSSGTQYCDINNINTGASSKTALSVTNQQRFEAECDVSALFNPPSLRGPASFLEEREEMSLTFEYEEDGLTFTKRAETQILI